MGEFGQKLKQEREKKGISLAEVALATKIGTRMLRAIEEEHFNQLPGGIFNKGFVRAYAKHLGLNEEQTVADYLAALNATLPQPPVVTPRPEPEVKQEAPQSPASALWVPGLFSWGRVAIALLVLAVGLGFWNLRSRRATPEPAPVATETGTSPAPASSASKKEEPPQPSRTAATTAVSAKPTTPSHNTASAAPAPSSASQADGLFHVLVRARQDSWLLVTADGKEVMQDTLLAEGQRYVGAENEIVIKSGNVGGLEFWFNGQKLPSQGDPDQVKTLTFDPHGLVSPTARVQSPISNGVN